MKQFVASFAIPLFATYLFAQSTTTSQTTRTETTTANTFNGTLMDAGCRTTHTERKETKSDDTSTSTKTENTNTTDCPVTADTSTFGIMTADGKFMKFDEAGNTKVVEIMKHNKKWSSGQPVKVRVVGTPNGDVVVVQEIH